MNLKEELTNTVVGCPDEETHSLVKAIYLSVGFRDFGDEYVEDYWGTDGYGNFLSGNTSYDTILNLDELITKVAPDWAVDICRVDDRFFWSDGKRYTQAIMKEGPSKHYNDYISGYNVIYTIKRPVPEWTPTVGEECRYKAEDTNNWYTGKVVAQDGEMWVLSTAENDPHSAAYDGFGMKSLKPVELSEEEKFKHVADSVMSWNGITKAGTIQELWDSGKFKLVEEE